MKSRWSKPRSIGALCRKADLAAQGISSNAGPISDPMGSNYGRGTTTPDGPRLRKDRTHRCMVEVAAGDGLLSRSGDNLCDLARFHGSRLLDFQRLRKFGLWGSQRGHHRMSDPGNRVQWQSCPIATLFPSHYPRCRWIGIDGSPVPVVDEPGNVHSHHPCWIPRHMLLLSQGLLPLLFRQPCCLCCKHTFWRIQWREI